MEFTDYRTALDQLIAGDTHLSVEQVETLAEDIALGRVEPHQLSALLALFAARGETKELVFGFAEVFRRHVISVEHPFEKVLDIVGTGGDGHDTINISTAAAIVAASCGAKVAKHGSISSSSKSGSADVLKALGVHMLPPSAMTPCMERCGIAFMLATHFHPAMKYVVPVRRALRVRTIFNILGPLLNPAGASRLVLGVFRPHLLDIYARALQDLGVDHAVVVHCCGLDEFSPVGENTVIEIVGKDIRTYTLDPVKDFDIDLCSVGDLKGGHPEENAAILRDILGGTNKVEHLHMRRAIAMNAGAALFVYGAAPSIVEGFRIALSAIETGLPLKTLTEWSATTASLAVAS